MKHSSPSSTHLFRSPGKGLPMEPHSRIPRRIFSCLARGRVRVWQTFRQILGCLLVLLLRNDTVRFAVVSTRLRVYPFLTIFLAFGLGLTPAPPQESLSSNSTISKHPGLHRPTNPARKDMVFFISICFHFSFFSVSQNPLKVCFSFGGFRRFDLWRLAFCISSTRLAC
jgi:hypothetical protein